MELRHRISDLVLMLKRDRKAQVIAGGLLVALLFLNFYDSGHGGRRGGKKGPSVEQPSAGNSGNKEAYSDLITRFNHDLDTHGSALKELQDTNKNIAKKMDENENRISDIFTNILQRMNEMEANVTQGGMYGHDKSKALDVAPETVVDVVTDSGGLENFGDTTPPEPGPPPPPEAGRVSYVGVGDSVRVKLIAGVDAPTDGTPYPTLFQLIDDVNGPDGTQLPLGEARIVAAAQGSLTDARVLFRITNLSIRLPDGSRQDHKVDGWVVGEDGLRGMEGIPIDPLGKIIGASAMSGAVRGVGDAIAAANSTTRILPYGAYETIIDGEVHEYAAGKAMSGAARSWDAIIRDRAEDLIPHIRVFSGREATAVFARPLEIKGLYDQLDEEDGVYASLD